MLHTHAVATASWALTLPLLLLACGADLPPTPEEQTVRYEEQVLTLENAHVLLVRQRLEEVLYERLPRAEAAGEEADARRACDYARARMRSLEGRELPEALVSLRKRVDDRCTIEVALLSLRRLLDDVRGAEGEYREKRCETGRISIAFVFDHPSEDAELKALREELFGLCPQLEVIWQDAERDRAKSKNEAPPSAPEPTPGEDRGAPSP